MNLMRGLFLILVLSSTNTVLFSAEAGMPQLDPTYWASQAFWLILVFSILYVSIAKFYLPKIKKNLDDRENKIKEDLDEANELKRISEEKLAEYDLIMENSKKEISKTILEAKKKLSDDIEMKKSAIEKEIEIEMTKTQKDIFDLKKHRTIIVWRSQKAESGALVEDLEFWSKSSRKAKPDPGSLLDRSSSSRSRRMQNISLNGTLEVDFGSLFDRKSIKNRPK